MTTDPESSRRLRVAACKRAPPSRAATPSRHPSCGSARRNLRQLLGHDVWIAGPLEFRQVNEPDGRVHLDLAGDSGVVGCREPGRLGDGPRLPGPKPAPPLVAESRVRSPPPTSPVGAVGWSGDRHPAHLDACGRRGRAARLAPARPGSAASSRSARVSTRADGRWRSPVPTTAWLRRSGSIRIRQRRRRRAGSTSSARFSPSRTSSPSARRGSTGTTAPTRCESSASSSTCTWRLPRSSGCRRHPQPRRERGDGRGARSLPGDSRPPLLLRARAARAGAPAAVLRLVCGERDVPERRRSPRCRHADSGRTGSSPRRTARTCLRNPSAADATNPPT